MTHFYLSEKLQSAGRKITTNGVVDPVVEVLRRVRGPFAVIWLHVDTRRVYFAYDRFGRRSLLYRRWGSSRCGDMLAELAGAETTVKKFFPSDVTRFVLSNVAIGDDDHDLMQYQELPASGIYVMDLRTTNDTRLSYQMTFHPYAPIVPKLPLTMPQSEAPTHIFDRFGCKLPCPAGMIKADLATNMLESSGRALLIALSDAVGVRVRSIPSRSSLEDLGSTARVAVLFSGVCFDEISNFVSPDRRAAELAHAELCTLFPERPWNLVKVNVSLVELLKKQRKVQALMAPCDTHMDFNIGTAFWFLSRGRGVLTKSTQAADIATLDELNALFNPQQADLPAMEAKVAAVPLFDDKTVNGSALLCLVIQCGQKRKHGCVLRVCKSCCVKIQRAVHKLVPLKSQHVDQRQIQGCRTKLLSMGVSEAQLDLLLDLANEHEKTSTKRPEQQFLSCFVHQSKQTKLPTLSNPTSALPRRGCSSSTLSPYQTNARVVFVGIGADEQLAGYGRHRTTLIHGGEQALRAELTLDLSRIWKRNLGRDDRCIAAHGREARFPYLDETVVSTIATFPVSSLCDAELPRGVGDKRVLRLVAATLGLTTCARLAKRAIQFGSRIAKVSHTGSSNRQTRGETHFSRVI